MKLWRLALPVLSASIAAIACSSDPVGSGTGGTST